MYGVLNECKQVLLCLSRNRVHVRYFYTNCFFLNKKLSENWGSKKLKSYKALYVEKIMAETDPKIAQILNPLRLSVKEQGFYHF
jgi:hypothetical protein